MVQRIIPSLLLVCCLLVICSGQPLEVIKLDSKSFEHETQASTGQTTGHWCVLFINSTASSSLQVAAEDAWEHLAEDEDKATIMAKVDVVGSAGLSKRFNLSTTPAAILFRDRSMYPLDLESAGGADADKIAAAVHAFMDGGYEHQVPHPVPAEATLLDTVKEAAAKLSVSPTPMLYVGVATMGVGLLLFLTMVVLGTWYMYAPDKPAKQQDPPAAATAAAAAAKKDQGEASPAEGDEDEAQVAQESSEAKPAATRATRRRA